MVRPSSRRQVKCEAPDGLTCHHATRVLRNVSASAADAQKRRKAPVSQWPRGCCCRRLQFREGHRSDRRKVTAVGCTMVGKRLNLDKLGDSNSRHSLLNTWHVPRCPVEIY